MLTVADVSADCLLLQTQARSEGSRCRQQDDVV